MHKILLVDDERSILEMLSDIIQDKFDCEVLTASNGLDAFLSVQKEKFDLIITDHNMPFMKGSAFIIATRTKETQSKSTPIIMLSGFIDQNMKNSLKIQNVEFLDKPFTMIDLISLIDKAIT